MKNKAFDVCGGILPSAGYTRGSESMRLFFFFFFAVSLFPCEGWGAMRVLEESLAWRFGVWGLGS